jgi:hypothetical protein
MNPTKADNTIDEIHQIRFEISDRFRGDIFAIAEDAARRPAESKRPLWRPKTTSKPVQPNGESSVAPIDTSSPVTG